ncbi:hypothetical protein CLL_A3489 [Clostridium botulinum B str. Eklund 17B (NRP)]|uniref:Uncharacterized protein n=1 Tax=Clostridium botulinum (strain Eklund 17B / Type B) TaxID=935198 RepID=B2TR87_CLOBB|nr:hypothetical protein CLL_A3489 [Clostridium botulinum B str. Eklund 17B (NRP)]
MPGKFKEIVVITISFLVYKNILKYCLNNRWNLIYTIKT